MIVLGIQEWFIVSHHSHFLRLIVYKHFNCFKNIKKKKKKKEKKNPKQLIQTENTFVIGCNPTQPSQLMYVSAVIVKYKWCFHFLCLDLNNKCHQHPNIALILNEYTQNYPIIIRVYFNKLLRKGYLAMVSQNHSFASVWSIGMSGIYLLERT